MEGVAETLEYLASRHALTICTKGHEEEQKLKIDRSGVGVWFEHTAIVKEKDRALTSGWWPNGVGSGCYLDDRELSEIRYQPVAGGRIECGVRAA